MSALSSVNSRQDARSTTSTGSLYSDLPTAILLDAYPWRSTLPCGKIATRCYFGGPTNTLSVLVPMSIHCNLLISEQDLATPDFGYQTIQLLYPGEVRR